jgi:hypothetical protein
MQQVYNQVRGLWEIKLDDGSAIQHPSLNLLNPHQANGFVAVTRVGWTNDYCAYDLTTRQEYPVAVDSQVGGYFTFISDVHFLLLAMSFRQGKHAGPGEIVVVKFDTQTKAWIDFDSTLTPDKYIFRAPGSSRRPNCLWIKNGGQVGGFPADIPEGIVIDHKFISTNEIEWTMGSSNRRLKRMINNGNLGAIDNAI